MDESIKPIKTTYKDIKDEVDFRILDKTVIYEGKEYQIWKGMQPLDWKERLLSGAKALVLTLFSLNLMFPSPQVRTVIYTLWQQLKEGKKEVICYHVDSSTLPEPFKRAHQLGLPVIHGKTKKLLDETPGNEKLLNQILTEDPHDYLALFARAAYHIAKSKNYKVPKKEWIHALEDLNKILEKTPNHSVALARRGEIRHIRGFEDQLVRQDFNEALKSDPQNVFALTRRAEFYRRKGELIPAFKDCNEALRLNPEDAFALATRGDIHRILGAKGKGYQIAIYLALKDLNEAIRIQPNFAFALAKRGEIFRLQGKLDEALKDLNKAIEINPQYAFALASREQIYRSQGKVNLALQDLAVQTQIK
jgi:Tfp pilus assembly protein PilF